MDIKRWQQIETLFDDLASLDSPARARELKARCGDDEALREEVAALLDTDEAAERYFAGLAVRSGVASREAEGVLHHAGRRIGAYRLLRQIGRGGMGVVYLAERADERFQKQVAVKVLPLGLVTSEARARFAREQGILARLEHPHIARLLDSGVTEEGTPYYVMEYIDGVPLDHYCQARSLGVNARLDLFDQVCEAVGYAHRNLVIHRDIKPSNILVDSEGRLKLLDFGVSKLMEEGADSQATVTYADRRPVTAGYAAPELLQGARVTTACDVYSLGVLLYELLTDRRPYGNKGGRTGVARRVLSGAPPPPPSTVVKTSAPVLSKRLRGDLDRIVAQAMRFEPEHRYAAVNALARDVERHRNGLPVSAMPGHWRYHASRFVRRHWIGVAFSTVALVLLLSLVAGSIYYAVRMGQQIEITKAERNKARAVSAMLMDMFASADPYLNQGRELSARELVDRGLREVETRDDVSAETRAELYRVLGSVYSNLSNFEMGRVLLQKSARLTQRIYGSDSLEYARLLTELAEREFAAGDLSTARRQIEAALTIHARQAEPSPEHADALYLYGAVLYESGEYRKALQVAEQALAQRRALRGEVHFEVATGLNLLGFIQEKMGRFDSAEQHYRQALQMARETAPANRAFISKLYSNLGRLYAGRHNFEQALVWQQQALEMRLELFGEPHRETATSRHNLSEALHGLGRLEAAKESAARAVSNLDGLLGPRHWLTARAEENLALILSDLGEFAWAETLLSHALVVSTENYGEIHRQVVDVLLSQAYLFNRQGRYTDAQAVTSRALAILQALPTPLRRLEVRANARLVVSLAGQGQLEKARALVTRFCSAATAPDGLALTARSPDCMLARAIAL